MTGEVETKFMKSMLPTTVQVIIEGQSTDIDRSAHGIRRDELGGPLSPNWDTEIHTLENITGSGGPRFGISLRLRDEQDGETGFQKECLTLSKYFLF